MNVISLSREQMGMDIGLSIEQMGVDIGLSRKQMGVNTTAGKIAVCV